MALGVHIRRPTASCPATSATIPSVPLLPLQGPPLSSHLGTLLPRGLFSNPSKIFIQLVPSTLSNVCKIYLLCETCPEYSHLRWQTLSTNPLPETVPHLPYPTLLLFPRSLSPLSTLRNLPLYLFVFSLCCNLRFLKAEVFVMFINASKNSRIVPRP